MSYPAPRRSQIIAAANAHLAAAILAVGLSAGPAAAQIRSTSTVTLTPSTTSTTTAPSGLSAVASPNTVAAAAKQSGKSAIDAAAAIKAAFPAADWGQIGFAMLGAGYLPAETAIGIQVAYNATIGQQLLALASRTPQEQVHALHEANKALTAKAFVTLFAAAPRASELLAALVKEYALTPPAAATMLKETGQSSQTVAEALKQGLGTGMDGVADALHAAGFSDDGLALGLVSSFNATAQQVVTSFQRLQVSPEHAAQTLTGTLKQSAKDAVKQMAAADYKAGQIARALKDGLSLAPDAATSVMRDALMTEAAIVTGLMEGFGLDDRGVFDRMVSPAHPAPAVVKELHDVAHIGAGRAAELLKSKGADAVATATSLRDTFASTPAQAAAALNGAKYDAASMLGALTSVFQLGVQAAAQVLAQIGVKV